MATVESFSTFGLDPRRKLSYWNDRACETFSPLVSDPVDIRTFNGSIARAAIGDLTLAEVYSDAQTGAALAGARGPHAHVAVLPAPADGRRERQSPGWARSACSTPATSRCATARVTTKSPSAAQIACWCWASRTPSCAATSPALSAWWPFRWLAASGVCALLSRFLRNFWFEYQKNLDMPTAARVNTAILDLVGAAYADLPQSRSDRSSLATAHRIRIINFIEAHLNDPDLTPTRIAEACKMTTRYLHHLFSDQDETVARYILRRRLEACSRALLSPSQRGRTVTAIAFDYGFNSPTHFGRVFRAKFGATPREYRREKVDVAA